MKSIFLSYPFERRYSEMASGLAGELSGFNFTISNLEPFEPLGGGSLAQEARTK